MGKCVACTCVLVAAVLKANFCFASPLSVLPVWSGVHIGGNIGYGWGGQDDASGALSVQPTPPSTYVGFPLTYASSARAEGIIGGAQIGYDWPPISRWVLGIEADFQGSGLKASGSTASTYTILVPGPVPIGSGTIDVSHTEKLSWFGTVRGRVGYALTDGLMLYGTGGLAYGRIETSLATTTVFFSATSTESFSDSTIKAGWAAGAGIQGIVATLPHWSWKVEYLHIDLGTVENTFSDITFDAATVQHKVVDDIVRVGLDYRFN
jgi:outer membrane immunogenic protein